MESFQCVKNEDGTYTFKMPASEVTVSAAFKKTQEPDQPCPQVETCPISDFCCRV